MAILLILLLTPELIHHVVALSLSKIFILHYLHLLLDILLNSSTFILFLNCGGETRWLIALLHKIWLNSKCIIPLLQGAHAIDHRWRVSQRT